MGEINNTINENYSKTEILYPCSLGKANKVSKQTPNQSQMLVHSASDLLSTAFPPCQPPIKKKDWFHTNSTLENKISRELFFSYYVGNKQW